jgi:hypothetical protein
MSDRNLLVLSPITQEKAIPEAYEVTAACGHRCWLSPGSQEHFLTKDVESICTPCFGGDQEIKRALQAGEGVPADALELVKALRKELGLE